MKDTFFIEPNQVEIKDAKKPMIEQPDDAIIRVLKAAVCGSDLWKYRGIDKVPNNSENTGHEAIGIVESVGKHITSVKPGDFVIAPFTHGCGHCAACLAGYDGACQSHIDNFSSGNQAEYIRYQHANWSLVKIPGHPNDYTNEMIKSFLSLSDVMATGYHAARSARVKSGDTVLVIGDGAVGLCAVIAAQMMQAKKIIIMSRHADRQKLALEFGATDIIAERGDDGTNQLLKLTDHQGADAILECVGTEQSFDTAIKSARPGAIVGRIGLPHGKDDNARIKFYKNIGSEGGTASVTTYDKKVLLDAVLNGLINPGKIFNGSFNLDHVNDAYQAMVQRKVIKSMLSVSDY